MNTDELQARIYKLVEDLDTLLPKWSKARADHDYMTEMRKVTLNTQKCASDEETEAGRERTAYASKAYEKYLWKAFEVDCEYFTLEGRKGLMEKELDAMRSLLSFEKSQINRTL